MNFFFIVTSLILHLNLYIGANSKSSSITIGRFNDYTRSREPFDHKVYSGKVTLISDREVEIKDFNYDGRGLYAYWSIGLKGRAPVTPREYGDYRANPILQDPNRKAYSDNKCDKPPMYSGQTVRLTLPSQYTWRDVEWLGIYCYGYKHLYNYINIPHGSALDYLAPTIFHSGNPFNCNDLFQECDPYGREWPPCYKKCIDGRNCAMDF